MATFTGSVWNFARASGSEKAPYLRMVPSGPASKGSTLFYPDPVDIIPDQYGLFSVELQSTEDLDQDVWWEMWIVWLDSNPGGFTYDKKTPWRFYLPFEGGELVRFRTETAGGNSLYWWETETDDVPPGATAGQWQMNVTTGDVWRIEN